MSATQTDEAARTTAFTIFRRDESPHHRPAGPRPASGLSEVARSGMVRATEAGMGDGAESRVLFNEPHGGSSLLYTSGSRADFRCSATRTGRTACTR